MPSANSLRIRGDLFCVPGLKTVAKRNGISHSNSIPRRKVVTTLWQSLALERATSFTSKITVNLPFAEVDFHKERFIHSLLNMMLDPAMIRPEDVDTLFSNIAANPLGNSLATNFLASRWDDIEKA